MNKKYTLLVLSLTTVLVLWGCASTNIIESPRTAYVSEADIVKEPEIIWTSRTLTKEFGYLGKVSVRSWSYEGALERLIEGGKSLKADALIDVHYERVGFLKSLQAFAVKFEN